MSTDTNVVDQADVAGNAAAAASQEPVVLGVLRPSGSAAKVDSLRYTPMYWHGVCLVQGEEQQVTAVYSLKQSRIHIAVADGASKPVEIGALDRIDGHFEGSVADEGRGAYVRSLSKGRKSALRIVLIHADSIRSKAAAHKPMSLQDAVAELNTQADDDDAAAVVAAAGVPF